MGRLTAAEEDGAVVGLWAEGQKYYGAALEGRECAEHFTVGLGKVGEWLDRYFSGDKPSPHELLLAPKGSVFRQAVWRILCEIPYGKWSVIRI